jgi:hypothetical protein
MSCPDCDEHIDAVRNRIERVRALKEENTRLMKIQENDANGYALVKEQLSNALLQNRELSAEVNRLQNEVSAWKAAHKAASTEKRKCALCEAEAVGKIGAEPRCERHV